MLKVDEESGSSSSNFEEPVTPSNSQADDVDQSQEGQASITELVNKDEGIKFCAL